MLFTLHRYIFRELFRAFLLAAVALTLILSLGSILQPVQEYGVGPRQVVHLMGYFLPITLTFVLPMAALFAGALVYGRFTSDNEFDACRASGISVLNLVYPGLALAIAVAIANLILSFYVMPVFVQRAEASIKADAKQILFRNIQRRRYYALPPEEKYLIYADRANLHNDTLSGVILAQMENSEIKEITTAEAAKIIFDPHEKFNEVQIIAYRPRQMGAEGEGGAESASFTMEFSSLLGDDIKFKKIDEMKRIRADLMRFDPIARLARDTYAQLTIEMLAGDIRTEINGGTGQGDNYYELLGMPNSVRFTADLCTVKNEDIELSGNIVIIEYSTQSKRALRTLSCSKATITIHIEGDKLAPSLTMDIHNAREEGTVEVIMWEVISGLVLPQSIEATANQFRIEGGSLKTEELTHGLPAQSGVKASQKLAGLQAQLSKLIRKTIVEIKAEIHSRLVFGTGCIPMILIGIGLGIIKKGGHLLSAFGASCVPAAVLIVCIMSGKQVTENLTAQTISGIAIMWTGLAFLLLLAAAIYGWLLRN